MQKFLQVRYPSITVHCRGCDSQRIKEINAVNEWSVQKQTWISTDSYEGYMYWCLDCGEEFDDYIEKELTYA